jgi:hypothetical protein
MNDMEMRSEIAAAADLLLSEPGTIGLYEVCGDVRHKMRVHGDQEIKRVTLEVVRELLSRGARPGNFKYYGSTEFVYWNERSPDEVIARIDHEWDPTKGSPSIDDVCWFEYPGRELAKP